MAFSLAAIPLPILIGVPVLGLAAVVGVYEYEKHKNAAAAAAAPQPLPPAQPTTPSAVAQAASDQGLPASSSNVYAHLGTGVTNPLTVYAKGPGKTVLVPITLGGHSASSASANVTGPLAQARQTAQQLLGSMPSPIPGDTMNIYSQVVAAALGQFINNPTYAQFGTTLTALQQAASSSGLPAVVNVYNAMNRANQLMQA